MDRGSLSLKEPAVKVSLHPDASPSIYRDSDRRYARSLAKKYGKSSRDHDHLVEPLDTNKIDSGV
jgi:hypothetical protein